MTTKKPSPPPSGVIAFAPEKYLEYVEDCEMTDAQKAAFLRALWDIMATFVRLGFGVESVLPALLQKASENVGDTVEQTVPTHEFNVAVDDGTHDDNNKKE